MKPVFDHWAEIASKIQERKSVFLALDFDGVLAPIASQPGLAVMPAASREVLENLVKSSHIRVAVVSGRSADDVRKHIGVGNIVYAGNHGAEIDLNGVRESHVGDDHRLPLVDMHTQLVKLFEGFKGVLLEDKGFGIGLHYREVDPVDLPAFKERYRNWSSNLPDSLMIVNAKMMYEIRPKTAWNKGNAVWHVWQSVAPTAVPICLGDDLTDEDGFRALLGKGINIYVGEERQSYAEFILHSQNEVEKFLGLLLEEINLLPV